MCPIKVTSPGAPALPPSTTPRTPPTAPQSPPAAPVAAPVADTFAPGASAASVFPSAARRWGSWAWNTSAISTPAGLDALLVTHKASGANELYLNGYPLLGRERLLATAATRAAATGLTPQVLLGSPEWADPKTRPWLEKAILQPLQTLRANVPVSTTARLPVHLDVEPHTAGPLTPQKLRDYLDTLSWFSTKLGPGFALQVDIPSWYQGQKLDGKDFTELILQRVDGVTLMAYARPVDRVLADVAPTLAQAAKLGKQAMVAVEAGARYAGVGLGTPAEVRRFLAQLDAGLAGKPGYGGCAVHGLEALGAAPPR